MVVVVIVIVHILCMAAAQFIDIYTIVFILLGARTTRLNDLKHESISVASYGRCETNHCEKELLTFQLLDLDPSYEGNNGGYQKIVHSAPHLFLFCCLQNDKHFIDAIIQTQQC